MAFRAPSCAEPVAVCVLHALENVHDCPLLAAPVKGVKLVTGMSDLADCQGTLTSLWMDARMSWRFPGFQVLSLLQPSPALQVLIYNSECLAPELQAIQHPQLRFVRGNIDVAWLA